MQEAILKRLRWLSVLAYSLILMVVFGIVYILMLPLFMYRIAISYLSIIKPELDGIVELINIIFIPKNLWDAPNLSLFVKYTLKGRMNAQYVKELLTSRLITDKNMLAKHSRLQQYPVKWMGYYFWKWEDNYNINDHVRDYSCKEMKKKDAHYSKSEIKKIEDSLLEKPFTRNKSMWEVVLLPIVTDDGEQQTNLYLRFSHAIADGYSLRNLLLEIVGDVKCLEEIQGYKKANEISLAKKIVIVIKTLVKGFYQLADRLLSGETIKIWDILYQHDKEKVLNSQSKQISMDIVKAASKLHGVGVSTVLYSALTSGVRKALMKNKGFLPERIFASFVMPICGHPDKLTNHMGYETISLPVKEEDHSKRLIEIQSAFDKANNSAGIYILRYLIVTLMAHLPTAPEVFDSQQTLIAVTSFPAWRTKIQRDYELQSVNFTGFGILNQAHPLGVTTCTYNNKLQFWIAGLNSVFTQEDVDDIVSVMEAYLQKL